jgi:AmiR/NasT family two-component response regulator
MNASQVIAVAKATGVKGVFVKGFKNGQVLMVYTVQVNGKTHSANIRAFPHEHA